MAAVGCIFAFIDFFEARGTIKKAAWRHAPLPICLIFVAGISGIWLVAQNFVPKEISSNTRIVAPIMLGFLALQFINILPIRKSGNRTPSE